MESFQCTPGISHLGDEKTRPTGHTAKSESIASSRSRVQGALTGASKVRRLNCVSHQRRGQRRGSNLCILQEEEGGQADLDVGHGRADRVNL